MTILHFFRGFLALTLLAASILTHAAETAPARASALFAGGCFWCL